MAGRLISIATATFVRNAGKVGAKNSATATAMPALGNGKEDPWRNTDWSFYGTLDVVVGGNDDGSPLDPGPNLAGRKSFGLTLQSGRNEVKWAMVVYNLWFPMILCNDCHSAVYIHPCPGRQVQGECAACKKFGLHSHCDCPDDTSDNSIAWKREKERQINEWKSSKKKPSRPSEVEAVNQDILNALTIMLENAPKGPGRQKQLENLSPQELLTHARKKLGSDAVDRLLQHRSFGTSPLPSLAKPKKGRGRQGTEKDLLDAQQRIQQRLNAKAEELAVSLWDMNLFKKR